MKLTYCLTSIAEVVLRGEGAELWHLHISRVAVGLHIKHVHESDFF